MQVRGPIFLPAVDQVVSPLLPSAFAEIEGIGLCVYSIQCAVLQRLPSPASWLHYHGPILPLQDRQAKE